MIIDRFKLNKALLFADGIIFFLIRVIVDVPYILYGSLNALIWVQFLHIFVNNPIGCFRFSRIYFLQNICKFFG